MSNEHKPTFAQREGAEPLPQALKPKEITAALRSQLWQVFYVWLKSSRVDDGDIGYPSYFVGGKLERILRAKHIFLDHRMVDDFSSDWNTCVADVRSIFEKGDYLRIFGFLEFVLRHRDCSPDLPQILNGVLSECHAAYRVVGNDTLLPVALPEEGETIQRAFRDLDSSELAGARQHLKSAASYLNAGKFADSMRESIHAVESVARRISPEARTLGPAIDKIAKTHGLHPAFRDSLSKLYGFTNDEQGIRHPLIDTDTSKLEQSDALFLLGACASFVSFLLAKSTK